jgi:translation initiation factor 5
MCAELGTSKEGKSIIKGDHKNEDLIKILDKFIEKYLICGKCKLPETSLLATKREL